MICGSWGSLGEVRGHLAFCFVHCLAPGTALLEQGGGVGDKLE